MRKHVALLGIVGGLAVSLLFNNCSAEHQGHVDGFSVIQEVVFTPCAFKDEMDLFSQTFHPFLTQNCASCHVPGGQGKGEFASAGLLVAHNAFSVVGYERVAENAVNPSHKPPYSGPQHTTTISLLTDQWNRGLQNIAECTGNTGGGDPNPINENLRLETKSKGINAVNDGTYVTISWDLPQDFLDKGEAVTIPQIPGAKISIDIRRRTLGPKPVYEISSPRLLAGNTTDLQLTSLLIKLNGKLISNQTSFRFVDEGVRQGTEVRLAPGSMVIDGAISPTDIISLSIGKLIPIALPPELPKPTVSFAQADYIVTEQVNGSVVTSSQNFVAIKLVLSAPTENYVTATVGILSVGSTATPRISETISFDGDDLVVDRWDWDYSFDTLAVVFAPNEVEKNLTFKISHDQRDEPNEFLNLQITSAVNAVRSMTPAKLTIEDDDDPDVSGAPTFTSLVRGSRDIRAVSNGVLRKNCFECHNSVDNRGGYNLADYDLMIENGVLIPGDVESKMFQRMNAILPGLRPMPLNGLLPTAERRQVETWIRNGAKNN